MEKCGIEELGQIPDGCPGAKLMDRIEAIEGRMSKIELGFDKIELGFDTMRTGFANLREDFQLHIGQAISNEIKPMRNEIVGLLRKLVPRDSDKGGNQ